MIHQINQIKLCTKCGMITDIPKHNKSGIYTLTNPLTNRLTKTIDSV